MMEDNRTDVRIKACGAERNVNLDANLDARRNGDL